RGCTEIEGPSAPAAAGPFRGGRERRSRAPAAGRLRAGRPRMPVGTSGFLLSRGYPGVVARAVLTALAADRSAGRCVTSSKRRRPRCGCSTSRSLRPRRRAACRSSPDRALEQQLLASGGRAREIIGWEAAPESRLLRRSVQWHISHPPADPDRISAPMTRPLRAADRRGPLERLRPLSGCSWPRLSCLWPTQD